MAKNKQPRKKTPPAPTVSVEERLAQALAEKPPTKAANHAEAETPSVGDRVTLGNSDTVYVVSRANADGKDVDLSLPGTNIERFRVPVEDLKFIQRSPRAPSKPAKPAIDIDDVHERLVNVQHDSVKQLSGEIAILKKYLANAGVREAAAAELDQLCKSNEENWEAAVNAIMELLDK